MAATGDGLRRPLNAPTAGAVAYGVQPGTSNGIDFARVVIVFGPAGTPVGVFVYATGTTPQLGNFPVAWLSASLVDPYGNVLPTQSGARDFYISNILEMVYPASVPAAPSNGIVEFVNNTDNTLSYENGNDGATYRTGYQSNFGNSGQLVNSTTPALIAGTAVAVAAGSRYRITGRVNFTGTGAVGGAVFGFANATSITVAGGATLSHADGDAFFLTPGTGVLPGVSIYSGSLAVSGSGTMTGALQSWKFDVDVVVSGGTVFGLTAQEGNAGDSFTVNSAYIRAETF